MTPWEGTITVQVAAEFVFEVTEEWEAKDADHARRMAEGELTSYLGDAFVEERFDEHWEIVEEKA